MWLFCYTPSQSSSLPNRFRPCLSKRLLWSGLFEQSRSLTELYPLLLVPWIKHYCLLILRLKIGCGYGSHWRKLKGFEWARVSQLWNNYQTNSMCKWVWNIKRTSIYPHWSIDEMMAKKDDTFSETAMNGRVLDSCYKSSWCSSTSTGAHYSETDHKSWWFNCSYYFNYKLLIQIDKNKIKLSTIQIKPYLYIKIFNNKIN